MAGVRDDFVFGRLLAERCGIGRGWPATGRRLATKLDTGLVEYFKAQAGERGYQTLINETLRQAMEHDDLEERLRRLIREEMRREVVSTGALPENRHIFIPRCAPQGHG